MATWTNVSANSASWTVLTESTIYDALLLESGDFLLFDPDGLILLTDGGPITWTTISES